MLSVAKLTLGQEAYYEQQVVRGLDDYYAGRGESPGIWAGRGAAELELSGVVEDGELGTLLRGASERLARQFGEEARMIVDEALNEFDRQVAERFRDLEGPS